MSHIRRRDLITELKRIEKRDGLITPTNVVEEARSENSPLHAQFDWNDAEAAEKFRLDQARNLIRNFRVVLNGKEQDAFHSVVVTMKAMPTRGYVSTEKVLESADLIRQVKQDAIREIKYWQVKYKEIEDLTGIVDDEAIKRVEATI